MPSPLLAALPFALRLRALTMEPELEPEPDPATPTLTDTETPSDSSDALVIRTERVERDAVVQSLELRVGARWHDWTIEVDDAMEGASVQVRLREPSGRIQARQLTLTAETVEGRSRELATALALLIDRPPTDPPEAPKPVEPTEPPTDDAVKPPADDRPSPSGWLGIGPRFALNPSANVDPDVGAGLAGGAWLVRDHLQPVATVSWSGWTRDALRVDALRFGGGLIGGSGNASGRWWGGGGVLVRAQWVRAAAAETVAGWWASPAVFGAVQYRGRIFVAGAWLGADLLLPPLVARDDSSRMRWGSLRPMATAHVGIRLPPRR